jgi:hypothetical protein
MLKSLRLFLATASLIAVFANAQVPLDCGSKQKPCPPVDPCKMNPDRCKNKGGPIKKAKSAAPATQQNVSSTKKQHRAKRKGQHKPDAKGTSAQPK